MSEVEAMSGEIMAVTETAKAVVEHAPSAIKTVIEVARVHPVATAAVLVAGACTLAWIGTRPGAKVKIWGFHAEGPEIQK